MSLPEEYRKLFILLVEEAGEKTNNGVYKDVEKILNEEQELFNFDMVNNMYKKSKGTPFDLVVSSLVTSIVTRLHTIEELEENENGINDFNNDFYERYLKRQTNKFLEKRGIEPVERILFAQVTKHVDL